MRTPQPKKSAFCQCADAFSWYSLKLKAQIETIESNDLKEMKTMVDLGSNFYAQAKM